MRLSEERFRKIFESSNDGIFIVDPSHDCILNANRRACQMLGYTLDELLKIRVSEIHPTDRRLDDLAGRFGQRERARGREIDKIRLEVWRIDYAPRTLDPTRQLLNARTAAFPTAD